MMDSPIMGRDRVIYASGTTPSNHKGNRLGWFTGT